MFYLFLTAHLIADFILQPYWLVVRKRRWSGLLIHGGIVLALMLLIPLVEPRAASLWPAMLLITVIHIAADWWKVNRADRLVPHAIHGFLLDQVIHVTTLLVVLGAVLPTNLLWGFAAVPAAPWALYAALYIVAAFAAPIGVMVWLDPTFRHGGNAFTARGRALLLSTAVMAATLVGGVLALPATLLGYAALTQRPASTHPLDNARGLLAVLATAATLAAVLVAMR